MTECHCCASLLQQKPNCSSLTHNSNLLKSSLQNQRYLFLLDALTPGDLFRTGPKHKCTTPPPLLFALSPNHPGARFPPVHTSSRCTTTRALFCVIAECSLRMAAAQWRTTQRTWLSRDRLCGLLSHFVHRELPLLLNDCREGWSYYRSCPRCVTVHVLGHEQVHSTQILKSKIVQHTVQHTDCLLWVCTSAVVLFIHPRSRIFLLPNYY